MKENNIYPFINPIISLRYKDKEGVFIFDGQYRFETCKKLNIDPECIILDEDFENPDFWETISQIREGQRIKLEEFFVDNNVGYIDQLQQSSSTDKIAKFIEVLGQFNSDAEYWEMLSNSYQHTNNTHDYLAQIKELFNSNRKEKHLIMDDHERMEFINLPEELTIYRGMAFDEDISKNYGISWTLDRKVAEKFAFEFPHNYNVRGLKMMVKELKVKKEQITALFLGRKEHEVIYIT